MPLLQPSFRGRLRLFFAVIVIVPMIAVGVVLFQVLDAADDFKLDSGLDQAQKTAQALYQQERAEAVAALGLFTDDQALATAIENRQAAARAGARGGARAADRGGVDRDQGQRVRDLRERQGRHDRGGDGGVAGRERRRAGTITASTTTAEGYADEVKRLLGVEVRVDRGRARRGDDAARRRRNWPCRSQRGADVTIGDTDFRTTFFDTDEPVPPPDGDRATAGAGAAARPGRDGPRDRPDDRLPGAGVRVRGDRRAARCPPRSSGCCSPPSASVAATSACPCPPRATTSSPRWARSSTDGPPARGAAGGPPHANAAACRRRSAASASRSRAASTASACSRSSCRPRWTASAPRAGARRCAGGPTRRWRRSPAPATRTPSTAPCTPRRRR